MSDTLYEKTLQMAKLLHLPFHIQSLPPLPSGLESLKGKKIVLVDDGLEVMTTFLVPLMMATDGAAGFVLQDRQTKEETVAEILALDPEVVLLDEYLRGFRGHELVQPLLEKKPGLLCIGFSNAPSAEGIFRQSGAGFVEKEVMDPWFSLRHVAGALADEGGVRG